MAATQRLERCVFGRGGSSPSPGTKFAPVVQRIEQCATNAKMGVRVPPGAPHI